MHFYLLTTVAVFTIANVALALPDSDPYAYQERQVVQEQVPPQDEESTAESLQKIMQEENLRHNLREALGQPPENQAIPVAGQVVDGYDPDGRDLQNSNDQNYPQNAAQNRPQNGQQNMPQNLPQNITEQQLRQQQFMEAQQPNGNLTPTY